MIQHIVLIKWKPGTSEAQIAEAFAAAQKLTEIDGVQRVTIGRNRGEADHGFTHALIVKLADADGLSDYLNHPVRQRYTTQDIGPLEEARIEIDVPEDAHYDRVDPTRLNWDWNRTRPSASAAAAALRWEERQLDA